MVQATKGQKVCPECCSCTKINMIKMTIFTIPEIPTSAIMTFSRGKLSHFVPIIARTVVARSFWRPWMALWPSRCPSVKISESPNLVLELFGSVDVVMMWSWDHEEDCKWRSCVVLWSIFSGGAGSQRELESYIRVQRKALILLLFSCRLPSSGETALSSSTCFRTFKALTSYSRRILCALQC